MSMRTHRLTTYLRPEQAFTLIEFLDQVREVLMQAYGDEIVAMLQQATVRQEPDNPGDLMGGAESF
jgi:hypothetical protein